MPPNYFGPLFEPITRKAGVFKPFIEGFVSVDVTNVVPGQPIDVVWEFVCFGLPPVPDGLKLRILIDGRQVLERHGVVILNKQPTNEQLNLSNDDKLVIYKFGTHMATVELSSERGAVWRSGSERFRVVREPVDQSWWTWKAPTFESIKWKTGYSLTADFHNRCKFANLSVVTAELSEVRETIDINPCDYYATNVQHLNHIAVGQKAALIFNFKHEWSWFFPAAYLFKGPINKTFAYAAFVSVVDEFGNIHQPFCSSRLIRHVGVSKAKKLALVAAQAAVVAAAGTAWFAFPFAALMYGIATGMAQLAKDPPEPDFDPSLPPEGSQARGDEELLTKLPAALASSRDFIRIVNDVLRMEAYRTVVRSKMVGAAIRENSDGFAELSTEYERVHERLSALSENLVEVGQKAADEFESEILANRASEAGLSADQKSLILDALSSRQTIIGLESLLRSEEIAEVIDAELNPIPVLATAVRGFVDEFLAERDAVLRGEEYVYAESFDDLAAEGSDSGAREPTLRRRGCSC